MNILFYHPNFNCNDWSFLIKQKLPQACVYPYQPTDAFPADYALIWNPSAEILSHQPKLKAIFVLGAGVDAMLTQLQHSPDLLPTNVPLYRLEDAGMAQQMQEYTIATVMRYFRRLDEYHQLQQAKTWGYLPPYSYHDFIIGVMGLGILGEQVAAQLARFGFTVRGWSKSLKSIDGVECYSQSQLNEFASGIKLLINLLPSTPQTQGVLNQGLFNKLAHEAYLVNIARGKHLIEDDLTVAIKSQQIKAATLDVFTVEPLPKEHSFWLMPEITITPHISALTKVDEAIEQIVEKILQIENGEKVTDGLIDLNRGY